MKRKSFFLLIGCLIAALGIAWAETKDHERATAQESEAAKGVQKASGGADTEHDADRQAIHQAAHAFARAFDDGDAKAVAAFWTEQGEYESEDGTVLRGRSAIEAAFAAHFKERSSGTTEIKVENIRFPSHDLAIEEGLTRTTPVNGLPDSAFYRAFHVREDGKWRIAFSREWGAAENRLADLDWLIGAWHSQDKEHDFAITFTRDKDLPFIVGEFRSTVDGKSVSLGTMRIGLDATGQFQSWHFDPDGGHGQGAWLRERNHWVVDSQGQQGDGTPTASVNLLSRLGKDEVGWRSIDRKIGGQPQPESPLIHLKRVQASK